METAYFLIFFGFRIKNAQWKNSARGFESPCEIPSDLNESKSLKTFENFIIHVTKYLQERGNDMFPKNSF